MRVGGAAGTKRSRRQISVASDKENRGKKARSNQRVSEQGLVGSGREVAQGINYKEARQFKDGPSDKVKVVDIAKCASEMEAFEQTGLRSCKERRLQEFEFRDETGQLQPLSAMELTKKPLSICANVHPAEGPVTRKNGRVTENFGPIEKWDVVYTKSEAKVRVWTSIAEYTCLRPTVRYKKIFSGLMGQAQITMEVMAMLDPRHGGSLGASLDQGLRKLARSKVDHGFPSWKEALLLNGSFILKQMEAVDACRGSGSSLRETRFAIELEKEAALDPIAGKNGHLRMESSGAGGSEKLDGSANQEILAADEEFARRLQAQEEAKFQFGSNSSKKASKHAFIRISEDEIAQDYPLPTQYEKEEEETDELMMAADYLDFLDPENLPQRTLTNFAIYNSEGFFASLELLPSWSGIDPDVELFGSGTVKEDQPDEPACVPGSSANAGGSGAGGSSIQTAGGDGIPVFLSQIKEWVVDCGFDSVVISIRTDACWYKLERPHPAYKSWYDVVLKCSQVAVKIISMIEQETRVSRLSLASVVKKLAEQAPEKDTFISKDEQKVQEFVTVHGQILLNQFGNYPNEKVKKSTVVAALKELMEMRRHFKLYMPKKRKSGQPKVVNTNPMKDRVTKNIRSRSMPATATRLVQGIWQHYIKMPETKIPQVVDEDEDEDEDMEDANDDEELEQEADLTQTPKKRSALRGRSSLNSSRKRLVRKWIGSPSRKTGVREFYDKARVGDVDVKLGDVAELQVGDDGKKPSLGLVHCLWETTSGEKKVQLRVMCRGEDTVLGDAASQEELFLTEGFVRRPLGAICGVLKSKRIAGSWGIEECREKLKEIEALRERNAASLAASEPLEYIYRSKYLPGKGMFCDAPEDLGIGFIHTADANEDDEQKAISTSEGFKLKGEKYAWGDFVYVDAEAWKPLVEPVKRKVAENACKGGRGHKGSNRLLQPFGIGKVVRAAVSEPMGFREEEVVKRVSVVRFCRPEDVQPDLTHSADFWDVIATKKETTIDTSCIVGKCQVVGKGRRKESDMDTFECTKSVDPDHPKKLHPAPPEFDEMDLDMTPEPQGDVRLRTLDIFAGCGGLSEGLHQAGAAVTKWAIEYDDEAAKAYRQNHKDTAVFCDNSSVILRRAMSEHGCLDDCHACDAVIDKANAMPGDIAALLPAPGMVDFVCGGPPCQGYSGMNRFNRGEWSMTQNSMVINFLSFADFYRPRFFLLENVRNFVSHNKTHTFRLTLRSLLDMGYQVRFGVLNAGNYGVPQSRKRTFIWAAAPGENLPEWPTHLHVFSSPQLTINLPGGIKYTAVPNRNGAPLRTVTVRDAIDDLPEIENGEEKLVRPYDRQPISAYQRYIRKNSTELHDHVCKRLSELNYERCQCIPKLTPGADWHVLQEIVANDPTKEKFKGQPLVPWCLPNTADRHNGWRGLFGRLDLDGHFPTSTTDPQPMGKVGQVFHPSQDRIVSVRECARSQGFPDTYDFSGTIPEKHRQIGNAVPPPLAQALGRELKKALSWNDSQD